MQTDPIFTITYTMTSGDYAAMTRAVTRRPPARNLLTLVLWLFSVWCLMVLFTDVFNPIIMVKAILASPSSSWFLAVLFLAVLAFSIFNHWFGWAISFFYYRQIASAEATITMVLSDTFIEGTSSIADTKAPWTTVKRMIRERDHLFLPISKREAFILPRRSFASDAEFDAACQYAAARIEASRS